MKNSPLCASASAGASIAACAPETAPRETHDTDDHRCPHCGGTGFDSGFTLEEADQPMPCMFCDGTGRSDGGGEPAGILGGDPDQAPAGGAPPRGENPLYVYLSELIRNHYMSETVISRLRDLQDWVLDCPGCASLEQLYVYLAGLPPDYEARRRRFVAIRSFVRWMVGKGYLPTDWTEPVERILKGEQ